MADKMRTKEVIQETVSYTSEANSSHLKLQEMVLAAILATLDLEGIFPDYRTLLHWSTR